MRDFSGKIAVVTGGGTGMGRELTTGRRLPCGDLRCDWRKPARNPVDLSEGSAPGSADDSAYLRCGGTGVQGYPGLEQICGTSRS